jgi:hypothetical protein
MKRPKACYIGRPERTNIEPSGYGFYYIPCYDQFGSLKQIDFVDRFRTTKRQARKNLSYYGKILPGLSALW